MHGPDVVVEHVSDWRPFDYVTKTYEFPGIGPMHLTLELTEGQDSTTVTFRGEALTGERLAAWEQMSGEMLAGIDEMMSAYVAALEGVAHDDASTAARVQES